VAAPPAANRDTGGRGLPGASSPGVADGSPFRPGELRTLVELAATFVPAGDAERVAAIAADALERAADPAQVAQLRLVLRALEQPLANLALGGPVRAFRSMAPSERERVLLRWATSRLALRRTAFHALRKLLTFIAYADPGDPSAPSSLPRQIGYVPDDPPVPAELARLRPLDVEREAGAGTPLQLDADVLVIGSGAGGGVIAAAVAAAGRSVLVVEAGPYVDESTMPHDELDAYGRLYLNYGLLSTWDGSITMLAGSAVGGGTLVNWMTCIDIPADVRDEWARDHGIDGLGAEWTADVAAIEVELGVAPSAVIPPKDDMILRGADVLGWDADVIRRNAVGCGDCGSCPFGCRRGSKQSGIRAHLASAAEHDARILDRARVRGLLMDTGSVTGAWGSLGPSASGARVVGEPRRFEVRARQVVLAAGALRSPAVLQSGSLVHPDVGRHLRIHPVPVLGALPSEPVDMWRGTMQAARSIEFVRGDSARRGYVIESAPGHLGLLALNLPWEGSAPHAALMAEARRFSPLIAITRDGGEGRTTLTRAGRVRIDYRLDDDGRRTVRHALLSMARLARAGGAVEILAIGMPLLRHATNAGGDEGARFAEFERRLASTDLAPNRGSIASAHQMGTIRIGSDPSNHPADTRGRVRSDRTGRLIGGLYVADGSTFPTGIGVNPMIGIMAMAKRVSRTVLAETRARG
jgi:choline dehydrogenase-like flavoprotein